MAIEIQDPINRVIDSRKMLTNASYFAFTATPEEQDAGNLRRRLLRRRQGTSTDRSTATR